MRMHLEKALDVESVERMFAELWSQSADTVRADSHAPMLRARVSNLLVFLDDEKRLEEVERVMPDLTEKHPSRALIMVGERDAVDRDIELNVETHCQVDDAYGVKRLNCERATLKAYGRFVSELPSAALPLLVSDLSTFLWWRGNVQATDDVFESLVEASDRLIVDSDEFENPVELKGVTGLFAHDRCEGVGISDLNWSRLTYWRELLADFYDVPAYRDALDQLDHVTVSYVPQAAGSNAAVQAFLLTGWLASRLDWTLIETGENSFVFSRRNDDRINVQLEAVHPSGRQSGRLVKVELGSTASQASFSVGRSDDNLHLFTAATMGTEVHHGRVLPVRNRSAAQLLSGELEILCNDQIYQEAVVVAAKLAEGRRQ